MMAIATARKPYARVEHLPKSSRECKLASHPTDESFRSDTTTTKQHCQEHPQEDVEEGGEKQ